MPSATSLESPRLVRIIVLRAQTRVHSRMNSANAACFERPPQQATEPEAKQGMSSSCSGHE